MSSSIAQTLAQRRAACAAAAQQRYQAEFAAAGVEFTKSMGARAEKKAAQGQGKGKSKAEEIPVAEEESDDNDSDGDDDDDNDNGEETPAEDDSDTPQVIGEGRRVCDRCRERGIEAACKWPSQASKAKACEPCRTSRKQCKTSRRSIAGLGRRRPRTGARRVEFAADIEVLSLSSSKEEDEILSLLSSKEEEDEDEDEDDVVYARKLVLGQILHCLTLLVRQSRVHLAVAVEVRDGIRQLVQEVRDLRLGGVCLRRESHSAMSGLIVENVGMVEEGTREMGNAGGSGEVVKDSIRELEQLWPLLFGMVNMTPLFGFSPLRLRWSQTSTPLRKEDQHVPDNKILTLLLRRRREGYLLNDTRSQTPEPPFQPEIHQFSTLSIEGVMYATKNSYNEHDEKTNGGDYGGNELTDLGNNIDVEALVEEPSVSCSASPTPSITSLSTLPIQNLHTTLSHTAPGEHTLTPAFLAPAPSHTSISTTSSETESDSNKSIEYLASPHFMSSNTSTPIATVISSGPHKIPTLSSGETTIEVFMRWKDACEDYFEIKEIKEDKRMTHAGTGLQDLLVGDWYRSDAARLRALPWDEFAKEFKTRWLPSDRDWRWSPFWNFALGVEARAWRCRTWDERRGKSKELGMWVNTGYDLVRADVLPASFLEGQVVLNEKLCCSSALSLTGIFPGTLVTIDCEVTEKLRRHVLGVVICCSQELWKLSSSPASTLLIVYRVYYVLEGNFCGVTREAGYEVVIDAERKTRRGGTAG
ncbi:hypothetical protein BDY19DRAFT_904425 [Irpex rosettiformis]|uniref:Uncharacterized protein n=1 Tax=Irpex rosettiformis TaxID=378272 RepID=A0ACB8UC01_9APHY|nr:hypothetical protein BDY19DRAFT_904425 [Irpex rosettiformis]